MKKIILLIFGVCAIAAANAQTAETVYLNSTDRSSNYYIVVHPSNRDPVATLFLIPGMFQTPADVLKETELPAIAARHGIITFIPVFKTGISTLAIDTATQASFAEMLNGVTSKYKLGRKKLYVGGFSIGGTSALKFAALAYGHNYRLKPSAVFAIDAPLDFERMYNTTVRELNTPGLAKDLEEENTYMLNRYLKEFGGSPQTALERYHKGSVFSMSDTTLQSIRPLVQVPIRLYTEPDIDWWLEQGVDYSGMNAFDFAAMTNALRRLGSKNIQLISTVNKGYRKRDNSRHPHSWSIAEPKELVQWLLKQNNTTSASDKIRTKGSNPQLSIKNKSDIEVLSFSKQSDSTSSFFQTYNEQCRQWRLTKTDIAAILKRSEEIDGHEFHYGYEVLPCYYTGQVKIDGKMCNYKLNAGGYTTVFLKDTTVSLGYKDSDASRFFLVRPAETTGEN
jgi:hypothetical protein